MVRFREGRGLVLAALLLVVAALVARMLVGAWLELDRARRATGPRDRVLHLRRAMAYYIPGNPWVRQAHDRLLALAREAHRDGQRQLALEACRELRSAILSLRGATRPFARSLPELDRTIAHLAAGDDASLRARMLDRLSHPPEPHAGWAWIGLLGFGLWVVGGVLLLLRGLRPNLAPSRRFWPLLGVVLFGLLLFGIGMGAA